MANRKTEGRVANLERQVRPANMSAEDQVLMALIEAARKRLAAFRKKEKEAQLPLDKAA
jgi:hypothetical protein